MMMKFSKNSISNLLSSNLNETDNETTNSKELQPQHLEELYKRLSRQNGKINRMQTLDLRQALLDLNLETRGSKDILKKRLKNYHRAEILGKDIELNSDCSNFYDFLCIIDFEATCENVNASNFQHEIIEFPAILLNTKTLEIVHEFHQFCRPVRNPVLSDFCKQLTGITQDQVDASKTFPNVLREFEAWLRRHKLGTKYKYAIVTDGPWDMGRFLAKQCEICNISFPKFAANWINIRKCYSNFYKCQRSSLAEMLSMLGLSFEGRQHCGLDDARNITRIVCQLLKDGAEIKVNEKLHCYRVIEFLYGLERTPV